MSSEQAALRPRTRIMRGAGTVALRSAGMGAADLTVLRPASVESGPPVASTQEIAAAERKARDDAARVGYEDGFQAGRHEAIVQARAQEESRTQKVHDALVALEAATAGLQARQDVVVADVEQQIVSMALAIAEAVLEREVAAAQAPARDALVRGLALSPRGVDAVARLNPADADTIGDLTPLTADRNVTIVPDPSVEAGGCVIDVGSCRIDAQIGPALDRVREALGA